MRIRDYHRCEVFCIIGFLCLIAGIFVWYMQKNGVDKSFFLFCVIVLLGIIYFTYIIAYELKSYYVSEEGITVEWFAWKQFFNWSELRYVRLENVISPIKTSNANNVMVLREYNSIVCSKIPINRRKLEIHDGFSDHAIDYEWLLYRPHKVFAIDLKFFKEGQLEEFWSYVPDRLK